MNNESRLCPVRVLSKDFEFQEADFLEAEKLEERLSKICENLGDKLAPPSKDLMESCFNPDEHR